MLDVRFVWKSGSAKISVSDVGYGFRLEPASYGSAMERTVWITGNLTGYITNATTIFHPPDDTLGTQPVWVAYAIGCDDYSDAPKFACN